jgi:uroporphyrinogen-III synthase
VNPRVLITRAPERAAELIRLLATHGIVGLAEPVTRTVFMIQIDPAPELSSFDWLTFTSVNAVEAFAELNAEIPKDLPIAVVGPATAKAVRNYFQREPELMVEQSDGEHLAEVLLAKRKERATPPTPPSSDDGVVDREQGGEKRSPDRRVFWPCAKKTTEKFARMLKNAGMEVTAWPVYETVAMEPAGLRERLEEIWPWRAAVFAAPSAVQSFLAAWPLPWNFASIAIGQTTAEALQKAGVSDIQISLSPAAADLAAAILTTIPATQA